MQVNILPNLVSTLGRLSKKKKSYKLNIASEEYEEHPPTHKHSIHLPTYNLQMTTFDATYKLAR